MIPAINTLSQSLPPFIPGVGGALITIFQSLGTIMSFQNEVNPSTRTQYSKFAAVSTVSTTTASSTGGDIKAKKDEETKEKKQLVSSETGMTIIYAPAFFVSTFILLGGSSIDFLPNPTLACVLCTIHFAKRVLEVKFLHRYSGTVELAVSSFIGTYYALISLLVSSIANPTPSATSVLIGTSLFSIGVVGNLYHHYLLANLRSSKSGGSSRTTTTDSSSSKRYIAPKGGLFEFVAAPHYLFELIGWLGLAIVAEHGNAFLVFTSMSSYLAGRAVSQNRWNREKFQDEWSKEKKNLIPFLF